MPYRKPNNPTRLTLPSDSDYYVVMKGRATHGDKQAAQGAMMQVTYVQDPSKLSKLKRSKLVVDPASGQGVLTETESQAYFSTLLERLIVEWNLDDEQGRVLPITRETIDELEAQDGDFLVAEAQARLKGRPPQAEAPFEKPSPESSPPASTGLPTTERPPDSSTASDSVAPSAGLPIR